MHYRSNRLAKNLIWTKAIKGRRNDEERKRGFPSGQRAMPVMPNTWQHSTRKPSKISCHRGAVHTWFNRTLKDQAIHGRVFRNVEEVRASVGAFIARYNILCIQEKRSVGNDNTVRYNNKILQIPQDKHRFHYVKATVRVHEYPDKSLAVFHGPRCLAHYTPRGELLEESAKNKEAPGKADAA